MSPAPETERILDEIMNGRTQEGLEAALREAYALPTQEKAYIAEHLDQAVMQLANLSAAFFMENFEEQHQAMKDAEKNQHPAVRDNTFAVAAQMAAFAVRFTAGGLPRRFTRMYAQKTLGFGAITPPSDYFKAFRDTVIAVGNGEDVPAMEKPAENDRLAQLRLKKPPKITLKPRTS